MAKLSSPKESQPSVTRITAKDSSRARKPASQPAKKIASSSSPKERRVRIDGTPLSYFRGAWHELRQVRWPDRQATWGMTGALIAFTAVFVVIILLLDALFKYLFELVVK